MKRIKELTFVDGEHVVASEKYKGFTLYKVYSRGTYFYKVSIDGHLRGCYAKLMWLKSDIDNGVLNTGHELPQRLR